MVRAPGPNVVHFLDVSKRRAVVVGLAVWQGQGRVGGDQRSDHSLMSCMGSWRRQGAAGGGGGEWQLTD